MNYELSRAESPPPSYAAATEGDKYSREIEENSIQQKIAQRLKSETEKLVLVYCSRPTEDYTCVFQVQLCDGPFQDLTCVLQELGKDQRGQWELLKKPCR